MRQKMPHARTAGRALVVVTNYMERGHPGRPVARTPVAGTRLTVSDVRTSSSQGALESRPPAAQSSRSFVRQSPRRTVCPATPAVTESERRWYRKRLTAIAISSLFRYCSCSQCTSLGASHPYCGARKMVHRYSLVSRCYVIMSSEIADSGTSKSIGSSSCQWRMSA